MGRKIASSYRELEARKNRANQLEKIYMDMALQKELQVSSSCFYFTVLVYSYRSRNWILHLMIRKRDESASCVKMRLSVQLRNLYSSGVQNESGERRWKVYVELLVSLSICLWTSIKLGAFAYRRSWWCWVILLLLDQHLSWTWRLQVSWESWQSS
jgi:hypothetical protein